MYTYTHTYKHLEIQAVHELGAHPGNHLDHADNNGELHLERVDEVELVARVRPPRVAPNAVHLPRHLHSRRPLFLEVVRLVDVGPHPFLQVSGPGRHSKSQ